MHVLIGKRFVKPRGMAGLGLGVLASTASVPLAPTAGSATWVRRSVSERDTGATQDPLVPWKLADIGEQILREEFSEWRSVAALFIAREWLKQQE